MSLDLPEVVGFTFLVAVGVLAIVGTLLHRAGTTSFIKPRLFKTFPEGALLLWGAGMVLINGAQLIPPADHPRIWVLVLDAVAICLFIASSVLWLRKPVSSDT